ncbi:hypothetical protein GKC56_08060 [Neisseriaceae bacterium PsAf]|nr:hypothetical protein [Neisseriaceae bacterium PsAf]
MKKYLVSFLAIGSLMFGNSVYAGPQYKGQHSQLNLTTQQKQQISNIKQKYKNIFAQMNANAAQTKGNCFQFVTAKTFDEKGAKKCIEKNQNIDRQLNRLKMKNEIYNVLTPEQQKIWTQNKNGKHNYYKNKNER